MNGFIAESFEVLMNYYTFNVLNSKVRSLQLKEMNRNSGQCNNTAGECMNVSIKRSHWQLRYSSRENIHRNNHRCNRYDPKNGCNPNYAKCILMSSRIHENRYQRLARSENENCKE